MRALNTSAAMRLAGAVIAAVLAAGCGGEEKKPPGGGGETAAGKAVPLRVHSGGTMYPTIQELAAAYEKETGRKVALKRGGSGPLFKDAVKNHDCDVYVCHAPFLVEARKAGVIDIHYVVAGLRPIIVVPKGNPKGIRSVKDLAREGLRVGITHEQLSTAGWVAPIYFRRAGIAGAMAKKEIHRTKGSGAMVRAVAEGKVDAGIVWNAVAWANRDKVEAVDVAPEFRPDPKVDAITTATHGKMDLSRIRVTAIVFKFAGNPEAARAFAAFVNSERGRAAFRKNGFLPAPPPDRPGTPPGS